MTVAENVAQVRERVAAAARRVGRNAEEIALMAVTKTVSSERIAEAYDAGLRLFGENRVQEFAAKAGPLEHLANAEWHMIGHLQSNKAANAVELFAAIDSVDSLKLATKLNAAAEKLGKKIAVLIEINIGTEAAKSGVAPDNGEFQEILSAAPNLGSLQLRGLMAIPPYTQDREDTRSYFRRLRELRDEIGARELPGIDMNVLSMGMSHDFEVAIEEGSTCVRIGTAIFGERQQY